MPSKRFDIAAPMIPIGSKCILYVYNYIYICIYAYTSSPKGTRIRRQSKYIFAKWFRGNVDLCVKDASLKKNANLRCCFCAKLCSTSMFSRENRNGLVLLSWSSGISILKMIQLYIGAPSQCVGIELFFELW